MALPAAIAALIETFAANEADYTAPEFKEAQVRQQFIDPFFAALGWDVANTQGYAEAYKEVIHEDAIKIGGETKAPDYSFRIGGNRKFFVEAKKPSVSLKDNPEPAFQLRRYTWTVKLPLGILTDFQEFAIYDGRFQPFASDKASVARLFYCRFDELEKHWDFIAGIFSKEAVLKGNFDKYAAATKGKRGTITVDEAFLKEIENWRDLLARNLALRNPDLDTRGLNFAVQRTIDRIVFLRIAEDRGNEPFGQLHALLGAVSSGGWTVEEEPPPGYGGGRPRRAPTIYPRLVEIFEKADYRYNSGLFHFAKDADCAETPDTLTPGLHIDDAVLKEILGSLYYPNSSYAFGYLPAYILGHVYEQFLGKVIRLTDGHQAKVEEKPEVRKAGGVYYTPQYIVDYIVQKTVGPLVDGKTPKQLETLAVLDPACGSGTFLLGAYDSLLKWYLDYYSANTPEKWAKQSRIYETAPNAAWHGRLAHDPKSGTGVPPVIPRPARSWSLTTAERKRILLAHIHGVDIDSQAVEVTKLSLLLKVLEGEHREFHGRTREMAAVLPDLSKNIQCGNSLIGHDFYSQPDLPFLDAEAKYKLNTFEWRDGFPAIMKRGGFDAVIGNPPYVRQESLKEQKSYFESHYKSYEGTADLFAYFMERSVSLLCPHGRYAIIVSSSVLRAAYAEPLRKHLASVAAVTEIVDFGGLAVFADAKDTYVCVPILTKSTTPDDVRITRVTSLKFERLSDVVEASSYRVPSSRMAPMAWSLKSDAEAALFNKIKTACVPLGKVVEGKMYFGVKTGLNEAFELDQAQRDKIVNAKPASTALIKPFFGGQDIRRYEIRETGRHLIVIPCGWTRQQNSKLQGEKEAWAWLEKQHPGIAKHLLPFEKAARIRQDQGDFWWELRPCDYYTALNTPKIIFPDIAKAPRFYPDTEGRYISNTAYCLGTADKYLVALLNSRLCWFTIANIAIPFGVRAGEYRYRLFYQYMEQVPIRVIAAKDKAGKASQDKLIKLVDEIMSLHRAQAAAQSPHEKDSVAKQITATDRQIDALVYQLYALTPEEIALVEGTA